MSCHRSSLVPQDKHVSNHILRGDSDDWRKAVKNHCLNNNITIDEVPIGIEVRVNTFCYDLRQDRNVLRTHVSTIEHDQYTCVDKGTDEHTSGNVFDESRFCVTSDNVHDFDNDHSDQDVGYNNTFRRHKLHT